MEDGDGKMAAKGGRDEVTFQLSLLDDRFSKTSIFSEATSKIYAHEVTGLNLC